MSSKSLLLVTLASLLLQTGTFAQDPNGFLNIASGFSSASGYAPSTSSGIVFCNQGNGWVDYMKVCHLIYQDYGSIPGTCAQQAIIGINKKLLDFGSGFGIADSGSGGSSSSSAGAAATGQAATESKNVQTLTAETDLIGDDRLVDVFDLDTHGDWVFTCLPTDLASLTNNIKIMNGAQELQYIMWGIGNGECLYAHLNWPSGQVAPALSCLKCGPNTFPIRSYAPHASRVCVPYADLQKYPVVAHSRRRTSFYMGRVTSPSPTTRQFTNGGPNVTLNTQYSMQQVASAKATYPSIAFFPANFVFRLQGSDKNSVVLMHNDAPTCFAPLALDRSSAGAANTQDMPIYAVDCAQLGAQPRFKIDDKLGVMTMLTIPYRLAIDPATSIINAAVNPDTNWKDAALSQNFVSFEFYADFVGSPLPGATVLTGSRAS